MQRQVVWCLTAVLCAALIGGGIALQGLPARTHIPSPSRFRFLDAGKFPEALLPGDSAAVGDVAFGVFDGMTGELWVREWREGGWHWEKLR